MQLQSIATQPALATPAAAAPVGATPAAAPVTQPVEDAGFAASLLGKVGQAQERFIANQHVLGEITGLLGARLSQIGSNVMALLRGDVPASPTP